ncbi:TlpA family protein disulfide reductase [Frateuria sp. GZRR33]|uniref:TlpA family protein disulfide reductase n=1 Tax=Frateuria sp. GZRR33 TaxID=3351535 RepID=UPI003EDBB949
MSRRWWGVVLVLTLFAVLASSLAWLAIAAPTGELPPLGSAVPAIAYRTPEGAVARLDGQQAPLAVMIFRESCPHCRQQIQALLAHWPEFHLDRLVMLTYEREDLAKPSRDLQAMGRLPGVTLGYLDPREVAGSFGGLATPALFVYGADRRLVRVFIGEFQASRVAATHSSSHLAAR